jgi:hypothetical protein
LGKIIRNKKFSLVILKECVPPYISHYFDLGSGSVFLLKVSGSILSDDNLDGLI